VSNTLLDQDLSLANSISLDIFLCSAAEDVELWCAEVENLLAIEDLGKVHFHVLSAELVNMKLFVKKKEACKCPSTFRSIFKCDIILVFFPS